MQTIHFINHNFALQSAQTLSVLHKLCPEKTRLIWLVDDEKTAKELIQWIWQQDLWIVADLLSENLPGIALAWPGLTLPKDVALLNSSSLSLESYRQPTLTELVHKDNKIEMRKRFKFYQQQGIKLSFEKVE